MYRLIMYNLLVVILLLVIGLDILQVQAKPTGRPHIYKPHQQKKNSNAILGTSIAAGILVATMIILVFLCVLWKRKCPVGRRTEKKDKPREPAKIPSSDQPYDEINQGKLPLSDPEEPKYSEPYDHVKRPHFFNRNSGDYDYAVIEKSSPLPKPVVRESNNSLTITENDLYLQDGKGKPTRNSAGILIVENERYSSAGTGK